MDVYIKVKGRTYKAVESTSCKGCSFEASARKAGGDAGCLCTLGRIDWCSRGFYGESFICSELGCIFTEI